jgi:hypothetical protein
VGVSPGAQATLIPPPNSASRKPTTKPPKLATGIETRPSRMVATPAKTRTMGWNHMVRPSTISRTPMISDPDPVVVDIRTVSWPKVTLAYGRYPIGNPAKMVKSPAQNGRCQRQYLKALRRWLTASLASGDSALNENSSLGAAIWRSRVF